jgi:hypothetical protein
MLSWDKHSSLFELLVSLKKKFYKIGPRCSRTYFIKHYLQPQALPSNLTMLERLACYKHTI